MKSIIECINESIQGMSGVSEEEIKDYVRQQIEEIVDECDLNIEILDLYVHGSRVYGSSRKDSDLDIVVYYKGNMKEDSLFNILHDEEYSDIFIYNDIVLDINPIRDQETGSLEEYIKKDKKYHRQY